MKVLKMKAIKIMLLTILISIICFFTLSHAETVPTNWQSNSTSSSGNIGDSSYFPAQYEGCRLWNATDGFIEGIVSLPYNSNWDINFTELSPIKRHIVQANVTCRRKMPPFEDLRSCRPEARDNTEISILITGMACMTTFILPFVVSFSFGTRCSHRNPIS